MPPIPGRGSPRAGHAARRRQHGGARPLLRRGCCSRAASATRCCSACSLVAELFNVVQALGFWWTCLARRPRPTRRAARCRSSTSTCSSRPTASRSRSSRRRSPRHRGCTGRASTSPCSTTATARRWSTWPAATASATCDARCTRAPRPATSTTPSAARARRTCSCSTATTCPHPDLLIKTLPEFADDTVAYVQTPQYYANAASSRVAAASWSQQALFFGPIARGKDAHEAMFCCGTNVVFRRRALEAVGGFPAGSLTEDFAISLELHERGWRSVYVPEVLASGLGPEDLASYVSQQHRWARGCIGIIPPCSAPTCRCGTSCSTSCRRRTSSPAGPCSSTCRCRSSASSPEPNRSPAPPPTASSPPSVRTSPCPWRPSPASAPASTRSPPTRWRRRRSGSTSTPPTARCAAGPAASS